MYKMWELFQDNVNIEDKEGEELFHAKNSPQPSRAYRRMCWF